MVAEGMKKFSVKFPLNFYGWKQEEMRTGEEAFHDSVYNTWSR